jgi:hypothetical protein
MVPELRKGHTYFVGGDDWDFSVWAHNAERFYRAMSEKEFDKVTASGKLSRRVKGSSELGLTQDQAYAESLVSRRGGERKYPRVVEFEMKDGTAAQLASVAGTHSPMPETLLTDRPAWASGMPIRAKFERSGVISYTATTEEGLQMMNDNILSVKVVR